MGGEPVTRLTWGLNERADIEAVEHEPDRMRAFYETARAVTELEPGDVVELYEEETLHEHFMVVTANEDGYLFGEHVHYLGLPGVATVRYGDLVCLAHSDIRRVRWALRNEEVITEAEQADRLREEEENAKRQEAVDAAAGKLRVTRDARRQVLVEDGAFGLFDASLTMSVADLAQTPQMPDLIEGVLSPGLNELFGQSYSGKSYLAMDWGLCVATGTPWHGRAVTQARVLYLAMEGSETVPARVAAWSEHNGGIAPERFDVYPRVVNFQDADSVAEVRRAAVAGGYGLVVVDTLNRSFGGGNESDTQEMTTYVAGLSQLREASDSMAVLVLHHPRKDDPEVARGSSVLEAAMDRITCLRMSSPAAPERKLITQKVKSGTIPPVLGLRFTSVAESAVMVPFGGTGSEPIEVQVFRSLPDPVTRAALQAELIDRGHVASDGTARNRVGKLIGTVFEEVGVGRDKYLELTTPGTKPL